MKKNYFKILWMMFSVILMNAPTSAAESIEIVGSSTVYPFSTVVAERFSQIIGGKTPKIESTGSGGGIKLFCSNDSSSAIDITNSSRRLKKSEQQICQKNGIEDIIEVKIGYDGVVIVQSWVSEVFQLKHLTRREIFLALAKQIPDSSGKLRKNRNKRWRDINPTFPNFKIVVYGPPPTSGTRDAFAELVLEEGCQTFPQLQELKKQDKIKFKVVCHSIREDGAYIEAGENDNLIIQKLTNKPRAIGILGYSFLEQNSDVLRGIYIEEVEPTFDTILEGSYPLSRPLYFYAKKSHIDKTTDLGQFLDFFVSEDVMGEDGFLVDRGLIPLPLDEYEDVKSRVINRISMPQL